MKHTRTISARLVVIAAAVVFASCSNDIDVTTSIPDTLPATSPFTRAAQEDDMTITDFRRCYGVGFSYDGIWGEPCNFRDVHSRVLDFTALKNYSAASGEELFASTATSEVIIRCTTAFNHSQYQQQVNFYADADAKMIVFNGKVQTSSNIYEEGETNNFYCDAEYVAPSMKMELQDASISTLINDQGHTELLTPNFRECIDWIDKHRDDATVDSFLICYGSHLVTSSDLGGSITIHMSMEHDSLVTIYSDESLSEATIANIMKSSTTSEDYSKEMNLLNSADCSILIKGGDLSTIPNELLHFRFGEAPDLSTYINDWQKSINYNPDDYSQNNLEMTSLQVKPIWDFIPNEDVAKLVRLRVEGTADELISEAGYQNYVNTSFQLPANVSCKMGGNSVSFDQPAVANVIASGRYVATICRETIDIPDVGQKKVQVVYPIYNQQINQRSGYTTVDGKAYNVCWLKDKCHVSVDSVNVPAADGTIYLTYGVPGSVQYTNVKYQPCHVVIGYEWPLAIDINGALDTSKPYYLTYKSGTDFLLRNTDGSEQSGNLDGLPNWSLQNNRMVRNKDYYYYWNPNEISY